MVDLSLSRRRQWSALLALAATIARVNARDVNCACGYLDPLTKDLWTDTTILYFNETTAAELATNVDFVDLHFANLYEPGFATTFRQAAVESNIGLNETGALQLAVNPSTKDHLVEGSGIRTTRQDIQYGSFRAALQPAQINDGSGSALSMYYQYNISQNVEIDLVNADAATSKAWFSAQLPTGTLPSESYTFGNISAETRELNEWRFDWTHKSINFSTPLNSSVIFNASSKHYALPSVPGAVYFKHWSNGNPGLSQGPPLTTQHAWVGYIRLFYNSTITSAHDVFQSQCEILQQPVCSTEDYTLRTSSEFGASSKIRWKLVAEEYTPPKWAIYGVSISGTILGLVIVHAIIRRLIRHYSIPKADRPVHPGAYTYKLDRFALHGELTREMVQEKKRTEKEEKRAIARGETPLIKAREIDPDAASIVSLATTQEPDQSSIRGFRSLASNKNSKVIASALPTMYYARPGSAQGQSTSGNPRGPSRLHDVVSGGDDDGDEDAEEDDGMLTPRDRAGSDASFEALVDEAYAGLPGRPSDDLDRMDDETGVAFRAAVKELPANRKKSLFQTLEVPRPGTKFWSRFFSAAPSKKVEAEQAILKATSRIDYLDGLRGLACVLVSLVHFSLTFYPGFLEDITGIDERYSWVKWIRYTIAPFFFNNNFGIGVFFILSSRLIGVRFLKAGHLQDLAGSTFRRIPRLAFPILCSVTLEYFLIGVGATQYLQYLASITWSTWPYAVEFSNVGHYINEFLMLLYVQPPTLPQIIYNYCTGVLWTIPISISGSWLIFLGVIVIREIKTPWKRFGYYFFCMMNSWYALNWGAYFWVGLAISDLDVTYRYRAWGIQRWRSWLIVLTLWATVFLVMSSQWLQQVTNFNFPTLEHNIHPDVLTGLPVGQTVNKGFPPFNYPQVYSLFAATAVVMLCDLSSALQAFFNIKFLRALGYYSYSIYLLHGVIFWSWGSWLCVVLSTKGAPYWANILTVFITSYIWLAFSVYLWTPFADVFSGYAGTALWRRAQGRSFFATMG